LSLADLADVRGPYVSAAAGCGGCGYYAAPACFTAVPSHRLTLVFAEAAGTSEGREVHLVDMTEDDAMALAETFRSLQRAVSATGREESSVFIASTMELLPPIDEDGDSGSLAKLCSLNFE
jgi:hypothetical protein